jgi:glucose/arabinose dehydrogenase
VADELALDGQGRLRSVTMAPDGTLLVTTAEGGGRDRILRITPS